MNEIDRLERRIAADFGMTRAQVNLVPLVSEVHSAMSGLTGVAQYNLENEAGVAVDCSRCFAFDRWSVFVRENGALHRVAWWDHDKSSDS